MDLDRLYREYFRDVYRLLLSLCRDGPLAEELTQETFFKALGALDKYDGRKDVRAWLFAIGKNCLADHYRRTGRLAPQEELAGLPAPEVDLTAALADRAQAAAVHAVLHRLEEPYKEVFTLRVFGELPFERIGALFGKSAGWARVVYHRARIRILQRLEGGDKDE